MSVTDHLLYAAAWLTFGVLHSATAGASSRAGLGRLFGRGHRLAYNILALAQLVAVLGVGAWAGAGARNFNAHLPVLVVQYAFLALGLLLGLLALRAYRRSEEHTSELQSLMRLSYAAFCLKKKINKE